ncbi:MAG: alkaline phosphatase family protein [Candidatus Marinimicrobia bacterium]|nr:alkaline phosphatase family protein [Candidatus Neomarinimicrobiota bacterium]
MIVIGLDGVPFSFLPKINELGIAPFLTSLCEEGQVASMTTTLPPVSSVAWASFLTGENPGIHGITGFVDRKPDGYDPFVPTAENLLVPTIYRHLSRLGLRVCSLGVPATFPPAPINGTIVSGFLAPNLERAVYPPEELEKLKSFDYRLDIDAWSARKSHDSLFEQLPKSLTSRLNAARHYLARERWDLFVLHVLETDRLHHFLWREMNSGEQSAVDLFAVIYRAIDKFISEVFDSIDEDSAIIILSDHGFTELKKDVYLNHWMISNGYLTLSEPNATNLNAVGSDSKAFSMAPGRIYLHLKDKSPYGKVLEGSEAQGVREELTSSLLGIQDPETGSPVIERVVDMRSEWVSADFDRSPVQLPDLIAVPKQGYEIKGELNAPELFGFDRFSGMHSYGDAMIYLNGDRVNDIDITDLPNIICDLLNVKSMNTKAVLS